MCNGICDKLKRKCDEVRLPSRKNAAGWNFREPFEHPRIEELIMEWLKEGHVNPSLLRYDKREGF